MSARAGDAARATVTVAAPVDLAFEVFTQEIDRWWRRGPRFRPLGRSPGILHLEAGVGGRVFEEVGEGPARRVVEMGRVLAWEPPGRLLLDWRNGNFAADERTEVEVRFRALGAKTEITVEHRGWAAIRPDHPARHGKPVPVFLASVGTFWGDLLTSLRERMVERSG